MHQTVVAGEGFFVYFKIAVSPRAERAEDPVSDLKPLKTVPNTTTSRLVTSASSFSTTVEHLNTIRCKNTTYSSLSVEGGNHGFR